VQVNEDGTEYDPNAVAEARLTEFLAHKAEDVISALANVTDEGRGQLPQLHALETAGKNRKTVLDAIIAAAKTE
jgi:hypothetical protein